jgi:aspartate kinase
MQKLIVQKYGGMCLATPEKIKGVAAKVAARHKAGHPMIIAVSAMGKTTDELVRLAYSVSREPNRRELDMLLTTGERVSMSLLSMALTDLGCEAISFTGSQAGVLTDGSHSNAKIVDIKPTRLTAELERGRIVVLAGFQGVNPHTKEITTLGRGGTDTTAVAMAAAFKAEACEIIKEVRGLCSADPNHIKNAVCYGEMNHDELADMCFWGAKILHYRSVELARKLDVPLTIRFAQDHNEGTLVRRGVNMFEQQKVLAVNSHKEVHHLEVAKVADMSDGWARVEALLNEHRLAWPQILAATVEGGNLRAMYTSDPEHLLSLSRALAAAKAVKVSGEPMSSLTLTCHGAVASDLGAKVVSALRGAGIAVAKMLSSPLSLTVLIKPSERERATEILHAGFIRG